ncbi:hypothetical protein [Candidatus Magnetaquicoccus inordinatus]|uniref:hypothetical protein n=1 Tax=Candidatus Magnetaquicoccus inordinatus TaxID=2496818 RepID=UPI00102BF5F7|nr:hypothetical protein [Candidatus Magnetaquicoccus inordinatus]
MSMRWQWLEQVLALLPWLGSMLMVAWIFYFPTWEANQRKSAIDAFLNATREMYRKQILYYHSHDQQFCYNNVENPCKEELFPNLKDVGKQEGFQIKFRNLPLDRVDRSGLLIEGVMTSRDKEGIFLALIDRKWMELYQQFHLAEFIIGGVPTLVNQVRIENVEQAAKITWNVNDAEKNKLLQRYKLKSEPIAKP